MATPPTRVSYNTPAVGYGSTAATKTTPAFDVVAGDLLTFIGSGEDSPATIGTPSATGGSITWTSRQSIVVSQYCTMYLWTGDVGATATGITVSATGVSSRTWSFGVTVWRNHGGVGVTGKTNVSGAAPSLTLAGCSANSAIVCGSDDWNAADGTTRTWRTINGSAMSESLYFRNSLTYTVYAGYAPDSGAAGSQTVGLSAPGSQKYSIVGIEVLGTSSGSAFSGSASLSGSGTLTLAGTPNETGALALSGSGTLTTSAVPAIPGTLGLSGSGTLTGAGKPAFAGSAALSGSGTLSLVGSVAYVGSAVLSGSGSLALSGVPSPAGTLTLSGSGTLTLSGSAVGGSSDFSGLAMLTGSGALTASGTVALSGTLALGGAGTLTISAGGTVYRFEPPGRLVSCDPTGKDFLWSKVKYKQGDAVIKYRDGSFKQVSVWNPDEPNVDVVYLGGHVHMISDADAVALIQAGYGEYLAVVAG